jgi:CheY-like chemotaxis protein
MSYCKILIIDDDTDDVEILADAFTQSGVEGVHYVHSAIQAFIYLEGIKNPADLPKLIVTDLYLPGITGPEFLADLKKMAKYKHIHIIVLSGTRSEKEIEHLKKLGNFDYLTKPSSYDEYVKVAKSINDKLKI